MAALAWLLLFPVGVVLLLLMPGRADASLDGLDLKWWIASKLALPCTPGRPAQVACVRSQINCASPKEYVLGNFTDPYGMGSCLLTQLSAFLAAASVAQYSARPLLYQWKVRLLLCLFL